MQNEARFVFRGWQAVRMQTQTLSKLALILATTWLGGKAAGAELQFTPHFIDRTLPVTDKLVGDYGLTALVDLDRDGDLDFVLGGRPFNPSQLYWFEYKGADNWVRHLVGTNYLSDVGLAALTEFGEAHRMFTRELMPAIAPAFDAAS